MKKHKKRKNKLTNIILEHIKNNAKDYFIL